MHESYFGFEKRVILRKKHGTNSRQIFPSFIVVVLLSGDILVENWAGNRTGNVSMGTYEPVGYTIVMYNGLIFRINIYVYIS